MTHEIMCEESVYQTDEVILNATTLIASMVEVVGYHKYEEDE